MNKTENFPSVNMISLYESESRRENMKRQFEKYDIQRYHFYQTERWEKIAPFATVEAKYPHWSLPVRGTVISHLESLRHWYLSTNEPYAIFCDDDADFSTIDYWNFTFAEFVENLPSNWECVQLIRCQQLPGVIGANAPDANLRIQWGRWWGVVALMKREYVRKVIDRHIKGPLTYDLRICDYYEEPMNPHAIEYVENVLYLNKGLLHNFPLFIDGGIDNSTYEQYWIKDDEKLLRSRLVWKETRETFLNLWKTQGKELNIKEALSL